MDPYSVLGIPKDANEETIKKKYKKLALQFHPDKNPDPEASEKFKEISQAYKKITSKTDDEIHNEFPDLSSIFQMFSGQGIQRFANMFKPKGPSVSTNLTLELEEIFLGGSFDVYYDVSRGTGQIKQEIFSRQVGPMTIQEVVMTPEMTTTKESTKVSVYSCYDPESGPIILQNFINYNNGIKGDLLVHVVQKEHPIFSRKHSDLIIKIEITLKEALVGFEKSIKHLDHTEIKINCKSVIFPDSEKIIQGSGLNEEGSLIIKFIVKFPTELTPVQKEKLKEIL